MDSLGANFYQITTPWTGAFIISNCGKILPFLQPKGG